MAQTHRGKRSKEAVTRRKQRRAANELIIQMSFNDRLIHEVVCRTEPWQIQQFLGDKFEFCNQAAVPTLFSGIILQNDYGHGAFQS